MPKYDWPFAPAAMTLLFSTILVSQAPARAASGAIEMQRRVWMFYTGRGIPSYHAKDLETWQPGPPVFSEAVEWAANAVPEHRGMGYRVPDVKRVGDRYLLYYTISSMESMTSAIGLAKNPTLDASFLYSMPGITICSSTGAPAAKDRRALTTSEWDAAKKSLVPIWISKEQTC